ncbi:MAG: OPT/YSL family transporter, partial [Muribaculaceae bacterium]
GIPALAFSLGMFIPLELNTPLLAGGIISWFVSTRSKNKDVNAARQDRGTLLASGFIAGGALMGVVSAGLRFGGFEYVNEMPEYLLQSIGIGVYVALIAYLIWDSMRAKKA